MNAMRLGVLVGLWMLALQPSSARAVDPCAADAAKFCAGVQKGDARMKCLTDHKAQASDPCKAHLVRIETQHEVQKACAADTQSFCKDVSIGESRVAKCLKEHEAQLSDGCKKARAAFRQARLDAAEAKPAATNP